MWLEINNSDRQLLQSAVKALLERGDRHGAELHKLHERLDRADQYPQITIGVHGGLVQWVLGNPFPIRICDYDGEDSELPDVDERGQRCSMRFEPPSA